MSVRDLVILGCASQQPTRTRNHGAYLLRWNDEGLLFDPGEGTQRQFIFANIPPPVVTRIFISHFHGDHCLGLGSMLMRLNLDKVTHPIWCYYPASGKKYFDRLRHTAAVFEKIQIVEVPVRHEGLIHESGPFRIEAYRLRHSIENWGWRITESDTRKFHRDRLKALGIEGIQVRQLLHSKELAIGDRRITLDEVSYIRKGDCFAIALDTLPCAGALRIAHRAKIFLCESTYLDSEKDLARAYTHMTARQAAKIAREANAEKLVLTHYSARYRNLAPFLSEAQEIFPNVELAEDLKIIAFPR